MRIARRLHKNGGDVLSAFDVGVEELEDIWFPFGNGEVQEVVSVIRGFTEGRVNFEEVGFVEAVEFGSDRSAGGCVVVVSGVDEHDGRGSFADSGKNTLAQFLLALPGTGASTKGDLGAYCRVTLPSEQGEHATKGVADDGDALGIDARRSFQKRQAREGIVKMVGGNQHVVQVLASFFPLSSFFPLENVLHEGGLIRGKALPAATEIKESVAVLEKDRREICGCFGHGLPGSVLGVSGSGAVIE